MCLVSAKDGADGVFGFSVENSPELPPPVDKSQGTARTRKPQERVSTSPKL